MLGRAMLAGFARRPTAAAAVPSRKMSGHWLHKNVRYEENAGLREASYKTWEFDFSSVPRLAGYMFIPGMLFFVIAVQENEAKDAQIGKKTNGYGIMPPARQAAPKSDSEA